MLLTLKQEVMMLQLNEAQWNTLHRFYGLVKTAEFELNDSLFSGDLNKGLGALTAVQQAVETITGPENLLEHIRDLAHFPQMSDADRKAAMRNACEACQHLTEIEHLLEDFFAQHGRGNATLH